MKTTSEDIFEPPVPIVPIGWDVVPFQEAADVVSDKGRRVKQVSYLPAGKIPVIDQGQQPIGGFIDDEQMAFDGDLPVILFGDHTRSFKFVDKPFAVGAEGVKILRPRDAYFPKFLYYLLRSLRIPSRGYSRHFQFLRKFHLPLAPVEQQKRIVAEIEKQFSRLDEAVANLKRAKANLKRYKAAILEAAIEGNLTEDWRKQHPDIEPASRLLERILAERRAQLNGGGKRKEPETLDTIDLPPLPSSWKWVSLDQLFLNITDGDHQPPPQTDSGVPFLVIGNIRNGKLEFEDSRFVSRKYADTIDIFRKPARGDVLYTLVGSFGISLLVNTGREFCIQRHIGILRPHRLSPTPYLVHVLNSSFVLNQATTVATGTAQKTVPLAGLRRFAIPLAPLAEQQHIVAEVDGRLSVIEKLNELVEASLKRSEHVRRSTLLRAFEGKLVPALPSDESAHVLLKRLQTRIEQTVEENLSIGLEEVAMVKRIVVDKEKMPIIHVLKRASRWVSTAELLAKAGYSNDAAPDEMETFYLELKKELQAEPRRIEIERRNDLDHFRAI